MVLGLDPGPTESALVVFDGLHVYEHVKEPNEDILYRLLRQSSEDTLVIEQIAAMGMAVGAEVFETAYWSGRFAQAFNGPVHRVKRHAVKMHLCNTMKAKDGNIRQALIDLFGGPTAVGRKRTPGPLYGISGDMWQALAVAVTWHATHCQ